MEPEKGSMAHPAEEIGVGRLPEPAAILERICLLLPPVGQLSGMTITVTAGPTREALDPIRYLSNHSSGKMGFALAHEARRRGAQVNLISGPTSLPAPPGAHLKQVESTEQMRQAVLEQLPETRVLIMAAAPADFKPRLARPQKSKKEEAGGTHTLDLEKTPDILSEIASAKGERIFVGFALETENGPAHARRKLQQKNLDLVVLNHPRPDADSGMGKEVIQGTIISADGSEETLPVLTKEGMAGVILDWIQDLLTARTNTPTRT